MLDGTHRYCDSCDLCDKRVDRERGAGERQPRAYGQKTLSPHTPTVPFDRRGAGNTGTMTNVARPRVLVVDDNERARALVRLGLELEGLDVTEARTVAEGRSLLDETFDGYVLDRQLPDGDGLSLVPELRQRRVTGNVIIYSTLDATDEPEGVTHVDKGDLPGVVAALGLVGDVVPSPPLAAAAFIRDNAHELAADWRMLCAWDPELPPE